jgi:hypothetical protein
MKPEEKLLLNSSITHCEFDIMENIIRCGISTKENNAELSFIKVISFNPSDNFYDCLPLTITEYRLEDLFSFIGIINSAGIDQIDGVTENAEPDKYLNILIKSKDAFLNIVCEDFEYINIT